MTPFVSPAAAVPSTRQRRVTDAFTRTWHWLFAFGFVVAWWTADSEHWRLHHVVAGYVVGGLLVVRLVESWLGPQRASLRALGARAVAVVPWLRSVRHARASRSGATGRTGSHAALWRQGQNLLMAWLILTLLLGFLAVTVTGLVAHLEWGRAWLSPIWGSRWVALQTDWHGELGSAVLWLVVGHVGLLLALSLWRRENLALPMVTGTVAGRGPDLVKQPRRGWALAVWLGVVVSAAWGLAGCSAPGEGADPWTCAGTEQVYTSSPGRSANPSAETPALAELTVNRVEHQVRLPMRIGPQRLVVKSIEAHKAPSEDGLWHYEARWAHGWQVGQFDRVRGDLNLVAERSQDLKGQRQTVRTVGMYHCIPAQGPLLRSQV